VVLGVPWQPRDKRAYEGNDRFVEVSATKITRFAGCDGVGWSGKLGA
jgi:hypothetical protein